MRRLLIIILLALFAFGNVIVKPEAAKFIDPATALAIHEEICGDVGITPAEIGTVIVISTRDDAREISYYANRVPEWGSAFAVPQKNLVVMLKPGKHPYRILAHELTHIIVHRKARTVLPRWFDEGIAELHSREWTMFDELKMANFAISGLPPLTEMESLYKQQKFEAHNLYSLAYQSMLYMRDENGDDIYYTVLECTALKGNFESGFRMATSVTTAEFDRNFRKHIRHNYGYLRLFTNSHIIWDFVLVLFLIAATIKIVRKIRYKKEEEKKLETIEFPYQVKE